MLELDKITGLWYDINIKFLGGSKLINKFFGKRLIVLMILVALGISAGKVGASEPTIKSRLALIEQIDQQINALEEQIEELYGLDPPPMDLILELELQVLLLVMQKLELQLELELLAPAFYGHVTDINGKPLEALIIAINKETKEKYKLISENGYYEITNLEPGQYLILTFKRNFQSDIKKEFLPSGEILKLDFQLVPK